MKTKAIVFREANKPLLEDVELAKIGPDQALVKMSYTGISIGTEQSIFSGKRTHNGTFPLVPGYMGSGVVEKVGENVENFKPGDRVVNGMNHLTGEVKAVWGGQCARHVANSAYMVKIPEGCDMKLAAFYVMPRVGLNAISMANVVDGDAVLISGQGLIGQYFGQWCRNRGAKVITIEPDAIRADLSRKLVTEHVLNPFEDDLDAKVAELTGGEGPDVVAEATANAALISQATRFLRMDSKMVFLSWYPGEITLDFSHFHNNAATAYFPMGSGDRKTCEGALGAIAAGAISVEENVTDVYPAERATDAYQRIIDGDGALQGVAIDWRELP